MILTLTMNPVIDKSTRIDRVVPDHKLRCAAPRHEPGGGGLNVSRAIHKLGGASKALYPAGGPTGEMLQQLLDDEGIDHEALPIEKWSRENLIVFEDDTDQQFRFGMPGPEMSEAEWQNCLHRVRDLDPAPEFLVASGSLPRGVPDDFYARLADLCQERKVRLIVDTSGTPLHKSAKKGVFLLKPNLRELKALVGREVEEEHEQEEAIRELIDAGQVEAVVLSLGAAGALLVSADISERLRTPTVPIKSKVGAGDSTVAGIVLGLERGLDLKEAARFGMAAGAAAVMTPGTELCRRDDTERLYQRIQQE